jgi:hypothetical protein
LNITKAVLPKAYNKNCGTQLLLDGNAFANPSLSVRILWTLFIYNSDLKRSRRRIVPISKAFKTVSLLDKYVKKVPKSIFSLFRVK